MEMNTPIRAADGTDITEVTQLLYDLVLASMDWGSGFFSNEEIESVIDLAITMGWQVPGLPNNSEPMVTVAQKYPEHYRVEWSDIPATNYGVPARRLARIYRTAADKKDGS